MKLTVAALLALLLSTSTLAAEGRWTEGFGQGNLEYFIDAQGLRLYIGCPTKDGSADASSSVSLQRLSDHRDFTSFTLTVKGATFDGPFDAESRVGTNNFLALLKALRQDDATVKVGTKVVKFPKSNAAKVIPAYGKKFECNLM